MRRMVALEALGKQEDALKEPIAGEFELVACIF